MQTLIAERVPTRCPSCQADDRARSRRRAAWLVLAALFVLGLFWSNRYEYPLCEYDGCMRVDRWTGSVGWVWSEESEGADDAIQSVQSVRAEPVRTPRLRTSEL